MGQVYTPPDDTRVGRHPVRTVTTPASSADPSTEQQVTTVAGSDGTLAAVGPWNAAKVAGEPISMFEEPFDAGALDTDRWTTGGTVPPPATVNNAGRENVAPGATTALASSSLVSKPNFGPEQLCGTIASWVVGFETSSIAVGAALPTGPHRFMGLGTQPANWTAAYSAGNNGPVQEGVGFEIDVDGFLYCVVYSQGTRTRVAPTSGAANLNVGRSLADGTLRRFAIVERSDSIYWYLDDLNTPVASLTYRDANWQNTPGLSTLPLRFATINGAAAGATSVWINLYSVGVAESNEESICDPVYPWREPRVTDPNAIANAQQYASTSKTAGAAVNVNTNAIQLATYKVTMKPAAAALVAGTLKFVASLHHLAASTKMVRIRRIEVTALMSAVAEGSQIEVHRITAAPSAGTVQAGGAYTATGSHVPTQPGDPNPDAVATRDVTVASIGLILHGYLGSGGAAVHAIGATIYDYDSDSQMKPLTLRPGVLEGIAVGILSNGAVTPTLTVEITYTEE